MPRKFRPYFTVLIRETRDEPWQIHFGDYNQSVAKQEAADQRDAGFKTFVITSGDTQAEVEAAVKALNTGAPPAVRK